MAEGLSASAVCRLCAHEDVNGSQLFGEPRPLATLLNTYLPLKVIDDKKLPRTICPGCNIQLEATAQFFELVIDGQKKLREILQTQNVTTQNEVLSLRTNEDIFQASENGSIYPSNHTLSLRMEGLQKPRRKRGRPSKKSLPPSDNELHKTEVELIDHSKEDVGDSTEVQGKRRRRILPKRFNEAVQGKELDRIFREEGVTDDECDFEKISNYGLQISSEKEPHNSSKYKNNVIGHMETLDGKNLGQLIINKSNKTGQKGRCRPVRQCTICSLKFNTLRRYMAHIAHHSQLQPAKKKLEQTPPKNAVVLEDVMEEFSSITTITDDHPKLQMSKEEYSDNQYYNSGPSMPDISSEIVNSDLLNEKETTNSALLFDSSDDIFMKQSVTAEIDTKHSNISVDSLTILNNDEQETPIIIENSDKINDDQNIKEPSSCKFQCAECGKIFNSKQYCDIHLKISHLGIRPYKCQQCNREFAYKISLQRHLVSHLPKADKGFACDICGKVLNHPSSVIYHKETEHNGRRFICNKCGKGFKHQLLLQRHQLVHSDNRPFSCKICSATFKTRPNLMNHSQTHSAIKKFSCEICNQTFAHKTSLTLHIRWHLGQKPYKCTVCSKTFSQNGNLSEHMRIHTGEKPYTCSVCQRHFTTSSQHRLHMERHKNERPWRCQDCGKGFLYKETWKCHIRRHRGEKPYACQVCGRRFTERWALRKHNRLHTGERPFSCNVCGRAFADCSNLTKHKRTHTVEKKATSDFIPMDDSVNSVLDNVNHVLCVTFNTEEDNDGPPTFHIVNESEINNLNSLYETETNLLENENSTIVNDPETSVPESHTSNTIFDQFVDEEGNPIQFTLQDGTHFAVTSTGGNFLQIENEELILNADMEVAEEGDGLSCSENKMDSEVQTVKFLTALDDNALSQYFTIS